MLVPLYGKKDGLVQPLLAVTFNAPTKPSRSTKPLDYKDASTGRTLKDNIVNFTSFVIETKRDHTLVGFLVQVCVPDRRLQ